jgi:hypothetical protein
MMYQDTILVTLLRLWLLLVVLIVAFTRTLRGPLAVQETRHCDRLKYVSVL